MKVYDISLALAPTLPVWPGDPRVSISRAMKLEAGNIANVSHLKMSVHTGTHVDAPRHFIQSGTTVDKLDLDTLMGDVYVGHFPNVDQISPTSLEMLEIPLQTKRLLLRTRNSELWTQDCKTFTPDYVALTSESAEWIVRKGIRLIGVDYLSVQRFQDATPTTHQILLENEVVIVEGLDLSRIEPGSYHFICLPLKLAGCEGAPARAILVEQ